jgi:hypothetical protein
VTVIPPFDCVATGDESSLQLQVLGLIVAVGACTGVAVGACAGGTVVGACPGRLVGAFPVPPGTLVEGPVPGVKVAIDTILVA